MQKCTGSKKYDKTSQLVRHMYGNSRHTINTGDRRSYYLLGRLLRPIPASVFRPVLQRNKINIIIFISVLSIQFIITHNFDNTRLSSHSRWCRWRLSSFSIHPRLPDEPLRSDIASVLPQSENPHSVTCAFAPFICSPSFVAHWLLCNNACFAPSWLVKVSVAALCILCVEGPSTPQG